MDTAIKLMATAGFAYPAVEINVGRFLAAPHHATVNGTNWSYRVVDPDKPAVIQGEVCYQFGKPISFRLEYTPSMGWTQNGRKSNGFIRA